MTVAAPAAPLAVTPPEVRRPENLRCALLLTACATAGAVALVAANRRAEWQTGSPYGLFWAGMLIFTLPAVYWLGRRGTSARLRLAVLIGWAGYTYLPKLLRNPSGPLYHDEYAHWRQSREILLDGRLFDPNPIIRVVGDFPGLHATVASIAAFTGLSVWHAALAVLIVAHVLLVLGVAVLAEEIWQDGRTAALAAVIYGLNSSFLYFDTQFGYESSAIALLVWTLVALVRAMRGPARRGWSAIAVTLAAATTATHHLTALGLVAVMAVISAVAGYRALRRRPGALAPARVAGLLTAAAAALVAVWLGWWHPGRPATSTPISATRSGNWPAGAAAGPCSSSR